MNKGSIYGHSTSKEPPIVLTRGTSTEFEEAYKKFWEKRGVDILDHKTEMPKDGFKLSDDINTDHWRLRKAIEYGRSYRKERRKNADSEGKK